MANKEAAYTHQRHYRYMVCIYSAAHFLVDFACAYLMFRSIVGTAAGYLSMLLYNFCAFAMQMPLGILADKWNRNTIFAAFGCMLVGIAYGFDNIPIVAAVIAGMGNGMFHVGGGIDILNISEEKSGALGIFVSPGAFGVYFGTMLGKGGNALATFILPALLLATGCILTVRRMQREHYLKNAPFSLETAPGIPTTAIALFLVVVLRSYVGLTLQFPWKAAGHWGTALICAVVFGKALGGFVADRLGLKKSSCISLGISALLFLFPQIPLTGVLSLLLFNMTMPITLWAMAKAFPGAKGFSFGLLTFGLFLGFLPVHLGVGAHPKEPWFFALAALLSLGLLLIGLRRAKP